MGTETQETREIVQGLPDLPEHFMPCLSLEDWPRGAYTSETLGPVCVGLGETWGQGLAERGWAAAVYLVYVAYKPGGESTIQAVRLLRDYII